MKNIVKRTARIMAVTVMLGAAIVMSNDTLAVEVNGITVEDAFARARPSSAKMGGAFLKITNNNAQDDVVLSAVSSIAKRTELHTHLMKDGVMSMTKVDSIPVPAGESVMLKPGGYHVMMMGLKEKMVKGSHFKVTLTLKNAGDIEIMIPVMDAGAMGAKKHTH